VRLANFTNTTHVMIVDVDAASSFRASQTKNVVVPGDEARGVKFALL